MVLVEADTPATMFVNDQWTGGVVDGDLETPATEFAYFGVNAFGSVEAALAAHPTFAGNIVVNGGDYSGTDADLAAAAGAVTLEFVVDNDNGGENTVTFDAITGDGSDAINTSLHGNAVDLTVQSGDFAGVISGAGGLRKVTDGTTGGGSGGDLILSGNNTYDGVTHVDRGRIFVEHDSALGSTAGNTEVAGNGNTPGGQVVLNANNLTVAEGITLRGGNNDGFWGGPLRNQGANNEWSGAMTLGNSTRISQGGAGSLLKVTGGVTGTNTGFAVNNGAGTVTFETNSINIGNGLFEAHAGGTTVINVGSNTWGNTDIRWGGILRTGHGPMCCRPAQSSDWATPPAAARPVTMAYSTSAAMIRPSVASPTSVAPIARLPAPERRP